jgi:hypothetical protein
VNDTDVRIKVDSSDMPQSRLIQGARIPSSWVTDWLRRDIHLLAAANPSAGCAIVIRWAGEGRARGCRGEVARAMRLQDGRRLPTVLRALRTAWRGCDECRFIWASRRDPLPCRCGRTPPVPLYLRPGE